MALESVQVRLRLTTDKAILRELKRKKRLQQDAKGDKLPIQFDAQEFTFRPGVTLTVGRVIANALKRSSSVIMGDDLTGEIVPALEEAGTFKLGEEARDEGNRLTLCPVCKKDCGSLSRLARHINVAHKTERPDLYDDKKKPESKTDWDTPILDDEDENALNSDAALVDLDGGDENVNETQIAG